MPILSGDVKLLKSAVMADVTEGGGAPTANVIADAVSNAIFPDISELDRAGGRVNLRKVFLSVQTDDTDTYFGGNAIVAVPFGDPLVSATLFSTGDTFDTRDAAKSRMESYLNKGAEWNGYLYENHISGQLVVQFFQRVDSPLPSVGQTLTLIENEGLSNQKEQYIRAVGVSYVEQTFTYNQNGVPTDYKAWIVSIEISDSLRFDFTGSPSSRYFTRTTDGTTAAPNRTRVRDTVVADAATYAGVVPLTAAAEMGDFTIQAESIYTQLVPSAQTETPLADVNPIQQSVGYIPSGGAVTMSLTLIFSTAQSLYIGGGVSPTSLTIVRGGITLTDVAGILYNGSTEVGQVDYENGIASLSTNVFGTGSGTHTVTYTPAAVPRTFGPSFSFPVTSENRSLSYVTTLESVPARGSLAVSFQVGKRWYVLRDNGSGAVKGANSGDGAGTINYETGTASVTLGALPDVGSIILYQWVPGVALSKLQAIDLAESAKFYAALTFPNAVVPESVALSWTDGGGAKTATVNSGGVMSGGATGTVGGRSMTFAPAVLPPEGTVVTANYSKYDTTLTSSVSSLTGTDESTHWEYQLPSGAYAGGKVYFNVYVRQRMSKIDDVWDSAYGQRLCQLFTIGTNGTTVYAKFDAYTTGTGGVPVGSMNWSTGKIQLLKTFEAYGYFQHYTTTGPYLYAGQDFQANVKHEFPQELPLQSAINTYTSTVVTGQTTTFTINSYQVTPATFASGGVSAGHITLKLGTDVLRQGAVVGQTDKLYSGVSPMTGVGTQVGTVDANGTVTITSWLDNVANSVSDFSGVWEPPVPGVASPYFAKAITFRSAASPLRPSSFTVQANDQSGALVTGTSDAEGDLNGDITGTVDYENGVITLSGNIVIDAATLRYNAVSYSYLPLDADIIGLDPVRLPSDGRVPIFRPGGFAVVGHTGEVTATVSNGQTVDCARVRLSRVRVVGDDGVVINTGYTTNLEAGTVTFTDVSGYDQPVTIQHRIEDMAVIRDAQLNGAISFTRPLTHDYPLGSFVSSALIAGDLFARMSLIFDQASWDTTWKDVISGSAATATFNNTANPITVTNRGALTERWVVRFTNTTSFEVIGEHVGVIATGTTSANCAPINPATGVPYFTIPAAGWGSGWAGGNVLRFNTIGAEFPVWVVRTVMQGPETVTDDSFTLLLRGDVDTI